MIHSVSAVNPRSVLAAQISSGLPINACGHLRLRVSFLFKPSLIAVAQGSQSDMALTVMLPIEMPPVYPLESESYVLPEVSHHVLLSAIGWFCTHLGFAVGAEFRVVRCGTLLAALPAGLQTK